MVKLKKHRKNKKKRFQVIKDRQIVGEIIRSPYGFWRINGCKNGLEFGAANKKETIAKLINSRHKEILNG